MQALQNILSWGYTLKIDTQSSVVHIQVFDQYEKKVWETMEHTSLEVALVHTRNVLQAWAMTPWDLD